MSGDITMSINNRQIPLDPPISLCINIMYMCTINYGVHIFIRLIVKIKKFLVR